MTKFKNLIKPQMNNRNLPYVDSYNAVIQPVMKDHLFLDT